MNNACPECGAIYAVAEKDIGRRIACKKCNAALIVTEKGLEHDGPDAAPSKREDASERDRGRDRDDGGRRRRGRNDDMDERPRKQRGPGVGEMLNKFKGMLDVATWLYAIGLFLTIYSFFTPQLDTANVASRMGDQVNAAIDDAVDEREVNSKNDGKPSEDDRKTREKTKKAYEKEMPRLKEKYGYAQASAMKAQWGNIYLRIIGLTLLAFGSIGYLVGEQLQTKRVLGAVTIGFILLEVVAGGMSVRVQTGGAEIAAPAPVMKTPG
jgi:DNA-directed RNA polymerase subunit M/transcription elongation factor TFIIS